MLNGSWGTMCAGVHKQGCIRGQCHIFKKLLGCPRTLLFVVTLLHVKSLSEPKHTLLPCKSERLRLFMGGRGVNAGSMIVLAFLTLLIFPSFTADDRPARMWPKPDPKDQTDTMLEGVLRMANKV